MNHRNAWLLMLALAVPLVALEPPTREVRGVTVVDLPAGAATADAARLLLSHIDHGKTGLVANAAQLTSIDQRGVVALVGVAQSARQRGGALALCALPAKAAAAVRQYDTGGAIRVFPTETGAVSYIKEVWTTKEGKK
jgi:anti-anti-sigma regulatory factor